MDDFSERRLSFDAVAERYDHIRPGYPAAMCRDLLDACGLSKNRRVLEIGCGTGQATIEFAKLGCAVMAVEIGENLARIASAKLVAFPKVSVVPAAFEDWTYVGDRFNLIVSATAFHWLPPERVYEKCASLLTDDGRLAIFANNHIRRDEGFFVRSQSIYKAYRPPSVAMALSNEDHREREKNAPQQIRDRFFQSIFTKRYPWTVRYSADEYIELLMTYSDHLTIPERYRAPLLKGLRDVIVDEYGGSIDKYYETELEVWAPRR